MRLPIDALAQALKLGASAKKDSDTPVRVAVYVDSSASPFVIETVRDALVPQTTSALVRVERLGGAPIEVRADTDVVLVLSCGSERLQPAVQEMLVAGAPVAVVAESSIEVPFITADTPMLGLIAATDSSDLLRRLLVGSWTAPRRTSPLQLISRSCASLLRTASSPLARSRTWLPARSSSFLVQIFR